MQACSAAWCMQQIEHASLHLNMQSKQALLLLLLGRTHIHICGYPNNNKWRNSNLIKGDAGA
jgi:hypothetical protein